MAKKFSKSNISEDVVEPIASKEEVSAVQDEVPANEVAEKVVNKPDLETTLHVAEPVISKQAATVELKEEPKSNVSLNNQRIHGGFYRNYGGLI
jgi:hypothetical protein